MSKLKLFPFDKRGIELIKLDHFGSNWPVVYLIESTKEIYVGETIDAVKRLTSHYANKERRRLNRFYLVCDDEFHKSAALDIESSLIQYFAADGKYRLQNGNKGLQNHEYYDRDRYKAKFQVLWDDIRKEGLARKSLTELRNSDLFKYSPFKALTHEQLAITEAITQDIQHSDQFTALVTGRPGTGKTILAIYLVKYLLEEFKDNNLKIGLVVPMTSLRKTIKQVFKNVPGLRANMVLGPSDVVGEDRYDVLIVDEAHRLHRRQNITNYASFDRNNKKLGLGVDGTELDWIQHAASKTIYMYDAYQSVRPSDVRSQDISNLSAKHYVLSQQMRVEGGEEFIAALNDFFDGKETLRHAISTTYDIRLYDDMSQLVKDIKVRDKEYGLSRLVAGIAWDWVTRNAEHQYDMVIDEVGLKWNSTNEDWVNSPNALNEVGCIHTVQGYDLNFVGVIIGPEITYDTARRTFKVNREDYKDRNGSAGVGDIEELTLYVMNIYKTLLTRGMKGVYVYIVDEGLREYFRKFFKVEER